MASGRDEKPSPRRDARRRTQRERKPRRWAPKPLDYTDPIQYSDRGSTGGPPPRRLYLSSSTMPIMTAGSFSRCSLRAIARVWPGVLGLLLGIGLAASPARADTLADVQRLYYGGQVAEATRRLDEGLAANADDPTLRFMKGVILADAKRDAEAVVIFERLTTDYPDLAEPYNNLAALYAADAHYDKARTALEQALRVNPKYATAWENLGDVLVALASQAYAQAVGLDASAAVAESKLAATRRVTAQLAAGAIPGASPPAASAPLASPPLARLPPVPPPLAVPSKP